MVSPTIAIRFRDTTPGISTIDAHREVLRKEKSVLWGWWKKDSEEDHVSFLNALPWDELVEILILDRTAKIMLRAVCVKWTNGEPDENDLAKIPKYYRDHYDKVFGWFTITILEDVAFDESVASLFEDDLLIRLGVEHHNLQGEIDSNPIRANKSSVLLLSDIHFGADYGFTPPNTKQNIGDAKKTLTECLVKDLKRLKIANDIAAIIITGDFTTQGDWGEPTRTQILEEFKALRTALKLRADQMLAVPGNHDIIRYSPRLNVDAQALAINKQISMQHEREFRTFVDELIGRDWKQSLNYVRRLNLKDVDLLICILDSCRIVGTEWTEYGFVGESGRDAISRLAAEPIKRATYKIMALHHHLLPVVNVEAVNRRGVTLTLDASDLLDAAQEAGVHVAIHGHQHVPRLAKYQTVPLRGERATPTLNVVSNGSAGVGTPRLGSERNTYCVFRFRPTRGAPPDARDTIRCKGRIELV